MSLLTICTDALEEIGGVEVPGSFYGNSNPTAKQCLKLVQREGKTLVREKRWTGVLETATITTASGTASYSLATVAPGFQAFANMSQWDRTNQRQLVGPTSGADWQWLKSGITSAVTINRWFRIQNGLLYIHPTPTSIDTLAFDYYSKYWIIKQSDLTYVDRFASDNDTVRFDEELLTMALKWRWLQAKGFPYEPEYKEYEVVKDELLADDGGKGAICLGPSRFRFDNLPDTGYGG